MGESRRLVLGLSLIVAIFLFIQISAISLVEPFVQGGMQPVEDPQDPTNPLFYVLIILVVTGGMLLAFKYEVAGLLRVAIIGAGAWISTYVFEVWLPPTVTLGGYNGLGIALAVVLGIALYVHPEWYVLDTAGALMGAAAAGLFGITFDIFPALVLLTVLAVYDAISVYRTEHMLTLASGVMDLKVPVVLVIPMAPGYSFKDAALPEPDDDDSDGALEETTPGNADPAGTPSDGDQSPAVEAAAESSTASPSPENLDTNDAATADGSEGDGGDENEGPLERDALFIGLGDAIIPSILVASATFFAPADVVTVLGVPLPALTAMAGTFVGLAILLRMVIAGRAHAGLPLLNGGSIGGYVVGALLSGIPLIEALGLAPYF
jgi:presenilin-like A22 family membrane protease